MKPTTPLEKFIKDSKKEGLPRSLQIDVRVGGKDFIQEKIGDKSTLFDLGSLTKILVTVPLCMKLYEEKKLHLDHTLSRYLPYFERTSIGHIVIKDLLRHFSGLEWWRSYYDHLELSDSLKARREILQRIFKKEKVKALKHTVYSDLDFILLGWLIEEILDMDLEEAATLYLFKPLNLRQTLFNPLEKGWRAQAIAPTERHEKRGILRGQVFDDNAWALGGVSGHAGLFSTLEETSKFGQLFLDTYNGKSTGLCKPSTLKYFVNRAVPKKAGDWALGFVLPSRPMSTAGEKVSSRAFGHTGFTGTSLWIDPQRKAVVTILSNRTYPNRNDSRFQRLRPKLHDQIWEIIDGI